MYRVYTCSFFGRERVIAACTGGSVSPVPDLYILLQEWLNEADPFLQNSLLAESKYICLRFFNTILFWQNG